jgi:hypothetical protein
MLDRAAAPAEMVRPWVVPLVRVGYAAKGIVYVLIGTLAFRAAAGLRGGRFTDVRGAIGTILQQPLGEVMLVLIAVGLLAYAAWQVIEGVTDSRRKGRSGMALASRGLTVLKGLIYGRVGWESARLVMGLRRGRASSEDDLTAAALRWPLGDVLLVVVGIGMAAYGGREALLAVRGHLDSKLPASRLEHAAGRWAVLAACAGIAARGLILIVIGLALVRAAIRHRPSETADIGESFALLIGLPHGALLLGAVAAGLVGYGVYELLHAKYAQL